MTYNIQHLDLQKDWTQIVKQRLLRDGYVVNHATFDQVGLAYFNLLFRSVQKKPRRIHKSSQFVCPPALQAGLDLLEAKIRNGDDLKPNQSKFMQNLDYKKDIMYYDFRIYHFHLGTTLQADGFVDRTGDLVYAMITNDDAYFLSIQPHGAWSSTDFIRILHNEFPASIALYRMEGVVGLTQTLTDDDRYELMKHQVNSPIDLGGGAVYMSMGQGVAASGDSNLCVRELIDVTRALRKLEKHFTTNFSHVNITNPNLSFKMEIRGNEFYIVEINNNLVFKTGMLLH